MSVVQVRVPVGGSRKASKNRDSVSFLTGLSLSFLEEDEAEEVESAESRCLILSSASWGPTTAIQVRLGSQSYYGFLLLFLQSLYCSTYQYYFGQGFLMVDSGSVTLSWGREDPLSLTADQATNLALAYGPVELPEFHGLEQRGDHSAGHSFSETEVLTLIFLDAQQLNM